MSSFVVYSVAFNEGEALLHAIHHTCPSTLFCDMKLDTVNGTPYVLSLSPAHSTPPVPPPAPSSESTGRRTKSP